MIFLHKPYIKERNNKARLIFDLEIDKEKKQVWYEVDKEYKEYLCNDRVDPILVGILSYAMRNGHDIKSDSVITDEILYQLRETLIPVLVQHSKNLKKISIDIKTAKKIVSANKVGTGCSGGVDSLYAILRHLDYDIPNFNIDFLCINNVGSFNECYKEDGADKVRETRIKESQKLANEINIPLIVTNSNFYEEIPQNHLLTCTFSSVFAILCLEKLWGKYYYGSVGLDYTHFHIQDNDIHPASHYDLVSLDCFSYSGLKIYSDGGGINRFDKLKKIYKSELYKKYVHVCTTKAYNCGKCPKCRRELLSLYLLDVNMDEYKNVFDVKYFKENINEYFQWILEDYLWNPGHYANEVIFNKLLQKPAFKEYLSNQNLPLKKKTINELEEEIDYLYHELYEIRNSRGYKLINRVYNNRIYNMLKRVRGKRIDKRNQKIALDNIIKEYANKINKPYNELKKEIKVCQKKYQMTVEDYINFQFDKLNDNERETYLTNGYMENFVKEFNDSNELKKFKDKSKFDNIFKKYIKRDFLSTKDLDLETLKEFIKGKSKIVYKPLDLSLGEGFKIFNCNEINSDEIYQEIKNNKNGIIEDYIEQHPKLKKIANSVNTIRVVTLNVGNKCEIISACLRMGVNKDVDNFCAGGIAAGIDLKTGKINTTAIDKKNNRYSKHPISGVELLGFQIPYWKETLKLIKECYNLVPEVRYIGFDVAITEDGPILVEGNASLPDYMIMQSVNEKNPGLKPKLEELRKKNK